MGTGSVAFDAAKAVLNKAALERGTSAGQWWADTMLQVLGGPQAFARVGLRQMEGQYPIHPAPPPPPHTHTDTHMDTHTDPHDA